MIEIIVYIFLVGLSIFMINTGYNGWKKSEIAYRKVIKKGKNASLLGFAVFVSGILFLIALILILFK